MATTSERIPDANALAHWLARFVSLEDSDADLLRVSQYLETTLGWEELYHRLHQVFEPEPTRTTVHEFLAALPKQLRDASSTSPELDIRDRILIVTTNYDDALERAFDAAGEPFDVVTYMARRRARGRFVHDRAATASRCRSSSAERVRALVARRAHR